MVCPRSPHTLHIVKNKAMSMSKDLSAIKMHAVYIYIKICISVAEGVEKPLFKQILKLAGGKRRLDGGSG